MDYSILAYYVITPIEDPELEVKRHKEFFESRDFRGRIYISKEGINGQSSGRNDHAQEYMDWLHSDPRFKDVSFKIHYGKEHAFPKMTVKVRRQLVAVDIPVDFEKRGESLKPKEWKEMLETRDPNQTLLIDVRNDYEWKAGHFEGAELPELKQFREFPAYARELKEKHGTEKPVMMYCTGGIRCEYYSAVMKEEGFEKVYQLDGGVIQYGFEEGSDRWEGKLFVFDDRLVVPLSDDAKVIAHCQYCKEPNDRYYNCANMDCNELFFCCSDCLKEHKGCCCDQCQEGRVRPFKEDAKPFRKLRCQCSATS